MHPIPDGSWVTGEFIQDWKGIKDKNAYIILTIDDGIVFKVVENKITTEGVLTLHSLNDFYKPYDLAVNQIREVWKFVNFISSELPEPNMEKKQMIDTIRLLKNEVQAIQTKLDL